MIYRLVSAFGVAAAALSLTACQPAMREPTVTDAWVRLPAVAGRPAAGYLTLQGSDERTDTLVAVESPAAERIELHTMSMDGGVMRMRPLGEVAVAAEPRRFAPGGDHLMIYGVDPALRPGGAMPLRFRFRSDRTIVVEARTVAAGDAGPPR